MESLHTLLSSVLPDLLRRGPLSIGKLEVAWRAAVGNALARVTQVQIRGSVVLVIVPDQYWWREVRRAAQIILARLETLLGTGVISRLEISIQGGNTGQASIEDHRPRTKD